LKRVRRWPVHLDSTADGVQVGPPETLFSTDAPISGRMCWWGVPGQGLGVADFPLGFRLVRLGHPARTVFRRDLPRAAWVASSPWEGSTLQVYDARSGQMVREEHWGDATVAFSPDGQWLVVGTGSLCPRGAGCSFLRVGTWELAHHIPAERTSAPTEVAFTPNGKLICMLSTLTEASLFDVATFRRVATLRAREPMIQNTPAFSSDGRWLAFPTVQGVIQLWDLHDLRRRLAEMGLDWSHG